MGLACRTARGGGASRRRGRGLLRCDCNIVNVGSAYYLARTAACERQHPLPTPARLPALIGPLVEGMLDEQSTLPPAGAPPLEGTLPPAFAAFDDPEGAAAPLEVCGELLSWAYAEPLT